MNYFAHAFHYLDQPWFMAGTAVPDWLSAIDRKVRLRPKLVEPWTSTGDKAHAEIATGILQHFADDDWFHSSRGFVEVTNELTIRFRRFLGPGERYHCGFLGHIVTELLIDGILSQRYPVRFERYWQMIDRIDPVRVQSIINLMARARTDRLVWFINIYRREQFLRSYETDMGLVYRLNQVLDRVKLSPVPENVVEVVTSARSYVHQRLTDLLPPDRFELP